MIAPSLLTETEAAEALHMEAETLNKWRQRDYGPPFLKQGGRIFYRPDDLKSWQDSCVVIPTSTKPRQTAPRRPHRKKEKLG